MVTIVATTINPTIRAYSSTSPPDSSHIKSQNALQHRISTYRPEDRASLPVILILRWPACWPVQAITSNLRHYQHNRGTPYCGIEIGLISYATAASFDGLHPGAAAEDRSSSPVIEPKRQAVFAPGNSLARPGCASAPSPSANAAIPARRISPEESSTAPNSSRGKNRAERRPKIHDPAEA